MASNSGGEQKILDNLETDLRGMPGMALSKMPTAGSIADQLASLERATHDYVREVQRLTGKWQAHLQQVVGTMVNK